MPDLYGDPNQQQVNKKPPTQTGVVAGQGMGGGAAGDPQTMSNGGGDQKDPITQAIKNSLPGAGMGGDVQAQAGGNMMGGGGGNDAPPPPPPSEPAAPPPPPVTATGDGQNMNGNVAASATPPAQGADPFAASGGGTYIASTGQWLPNNNPGAIAAAQAAGGGATMNGQKPPQTAPPAPPVDPTVTPGATVPTPPGAPDANHDLYTKALLAQMNQTEVPTTSDPSIAAQIDPIRAENQRAMEGEMRQQAESGFAGGQSVGNPEQVAAAARMGEKTGLQASQLVGSELSARRQQISDALGKFGAQMSDQDRLALQDKLATMDNAIKQQQLAQEKSLTLGSQDIQREGLKQTGQLGAGDLSLRRDLGTGGLNNDLIRTLLNYKQGNNQIGAQVGISEADLNARALQSLLGGA